MHHVVMEQWSRRSSFLHARDARGKLVVLLVFLIALATSPAHQARPILFYALLLAAGIATSHLPAIKILLRAGVILPFSGTFAILSVLAGDTERAMAVLGKSYLSAVAVLLLVGTTPLPRLLNGMESLGAPRMLVLVVQFLYRYLFVISEQAQHMRLAGQCRSAGPSRRASGRSRFQAAAGALAVLFARSYQRAEGIHQAMMARGFSGHFPLMTPARLTMTDYTFALLASAAPVALRLYA